MYYLKSEDSFDSAHFLSNYNGKCKNIHGHRWKIVVEILSDKLQSNSEHNGMIVDFSKLKKDIKIEVNFFDHALIIEKDSIAHKLYEALIEEKFKIIEVDFRPTAENFSKYFYDRIKEKGYRIKYVTVYETPNNSASYSEDY